MEKLKMQTVWTVLQNINNFSWAFWFCCNCWNTTPPPSHMKHFYTFVYADFKPVNQREKEET